MNEKSGSPTGERLMTMYGRLLDHFGPQEWWPAETPFEMMVGSVLTQNTSWSNVEKALSNLEREGLLDVGRLRAVGTEALALAIRPAGYYNVKAKRLKNLVELIVERYGGDVPSMLVEDPEALRSALLGVSGIGPETADSIVLYAAGHPVFVVDAYTHRILSRHDLVDEGASYDEIQATFSDALPEDVPLFREFHALIVMAGKTYCRKRPLCERCPIQGLE
ncbi:MAG: endonuclease III domain-containing protein [Deltaproteobacteria bacterium]|nr:endonuclease III domain-containing protein [Deltaproteobacteria bacterium]